MTIVLHKQQSTQQPPSTAACLFLLYLLTIFVRVFTDLAAARLTHGWPLGWLLAGGVGCAVVGVWVRKVGKRNGL